MKNLISSLNKRERSDVAHRVEHELFDEPWKIMFTGKGVVRLREMHAIVKLIVRWSRRETSK